MSREYGPSPEEMGIKPEEEKTDSKFLLEVDSLFKPAINDAMDQRDEESLDRYATVSSDLKRLAYPGNLATLRERPGQVADGLASLAGIKANNNPEYLNGNILPDLKGQMVERDQLAKKLFMEGCNKVFPNVEVNSQSIPKVLEQMKSRLNGLNSLLIDSESERMKSSIKELEEANILEAGNAKDIKKKIDLIIYDASRSASGVGWNLAEKEKEEGIDNEFSSTTERELAEVVKSIYELQQISDKLEAQQ